MIKNNNKSKMDQMRKIRDEILNFKKSPLYKERIENNMFPVIGEGSHDAKIMFIGEAPGKNEAKTGRPFCGASGKILDELLLHIKISRKDIYITNIVKDRPTNNRDPNSEEIKIYAPFLDRQISIIKPQVIATLGRFSMEYIMKKFGLENKLDIISRIHGKVFSAQISDLNSEFKNITHNDDLKTENSSHKIKIIPLYHPAVAVYNRTNLPDLKKDFEILKRLL